MMKRFVERIKGTSGIFSKMRGGITTLTPHHHARSGPGIQIEKRDGKEYGEREREGEDLLMRSVKKKRPLSPFFSIYQPQLTWVMSISHRITGSAVAVGLYGAAIGYVLWPSQMTVFSDLINWMSSPSLPSPLFSLAKFVVAFPFTFHTFNGIRHLLWDTGAALSIRGVYFTGWLVNIATVATSVFLSI